MYSHSRKLLLAFLLVVALGSLVSEIQAQAIDVTLVNNLQFGNVFPAAPKVIPNQPLDKVGDSLV